MSLKILGFWPCCGDQATTVNGAVHAGPHHDRPVCLSTREVWKGRTCTTTPWWAHPHSACDEGWARRPSASGIPGPHQSQAGMLSRSCPLMRRASEAAPHFLGAHLSWNNTAWEWNKSLVTFQESLCNRMSYFHKNLQTSKMLTSHCLKSCIFKAFKFVPIYTSESSKIFSLQSSLARSGSFIFPCEFLN